MRKVHKIVLCLSMAALIASCTKHETLEYEVDKPISFANQEAIDAYMPLKSYLRKEAHPNFKFGVALGLSEYVSKGVKYRLANTNFDEIVLGYEMKHGAVVQADGKLKLDNVKTLLETAKSAGMEVYGHTLCWHSNQNAVYLNKLIAPIIIPGTAQPSWDIVTSNNFETESATNYEANTNAVLSFTAAGQGAGGTGRALKITNSAVRTNEWDAQFFIKFSPAVQIGEQYELSMDVKADASATIPTQAHTVPYTYKFYDFFGSVTATPTWTKFTKTITVTESMANCGAIAFNLGKFATSVYLDNMTLKKYNAKGSGNGGYAYFFTNPSVTNYWTAQVAHDIAALQNGKEYTLKFVAKASAEGIIRAEAQSTSDYSANSFGTFSLGLGWKEYELKTTMTKADRNRLVISFGDFKGTVYMDNVKLMVTGSSDNVIPTSDFESGAGAWTGWGNSSTRGLTALGEGYGGAQDQIIQKTAAEKNTLITNALTTFIKGMLETCKGYVKAWDVVNEPMDDAKPYELKTAAGRTTIAADEFFWQDYMGKDYAVTAFNLARQNGNADDKLFINDYNLEYSIDKCKGLIEYVKYVEGKGAKVDGIGTQMHISITADKDKIAQMFTLLAATGKLIKVSELDIGLGGVKTAAATEEQYKQQKEMYKYVFDKYFELVPAKQRYGITIWSPTDSPANSSWRAGEPIGLWTESFTRKPAYVGVAEGLKDK
ncbi:endo-1,4-beta-xylanase [Pedobacter sp. MW01-1-1]|uniref:endo-1,4-beta-xylanase n=1 Tax=Pedobacter sp. MW01-1-1 TaxID=3383027 RepID=UPI003FEDAD83